MIAPAIKNNVSTAKKSAIMKRKFLVRSEIIVKEHKNRDVESAIFKFFQVASAVVPSPLPQNFPLRRKTFP